MKLRDIGLTLTICGVAVLYLTYGDPTPAAWLATIAGGGAVVGGVTSLAIVAKGICK